jgi:hypothetical protein
MKTKILILENTKILLLNLFILISCVIKAQETNTILFSDQKCDQSLGEDHSQNISFKLEEDTLIITGKIIANCCGFHLLKYEIYPDSIHLSRIDNGDLCDCNCLHTIDLKIGNLTSLYYKISLSEYSYNDGIETSVLNQTGLKDNLNVGKLKCYPNPMSERMIIELPYPNLMPYIFIMYDSVGKTVRIINDIRTDIFYIEKNGLSKGLYFYKIYALEKQFHSGIIIII